MTLLFAFTSLITALSAQSWQTIFFDNFNRANGSISGQYDTIASPGITQFRIRSNEVEISSGPVAPAYWIMAYPNSVNYDSIRISCKFRSTKYGHGFSINAKDNGVYTYSAGILPNSDSIIIGSRDYIGNSNSTCH
ncbi:MAG: hypothetical protein SGJ00_05600 [bacterium]|nr:hypothetical protein [bacterium]